jgi:hypothetical protein
MVYVQAVSRRVPKTARVSARVTAECRGLVDALMQQTGLSEGSVLEIVFREYASRHGTQPIYWDESPTASQTADTETTAEE